MRKLFLLSTLFLCTALIAQPCRQGSTSFPGCIIVDQISAIVGRDIELIESPTQADHQTEDLMSAYYNDDEAGLDQALANMDDSWFSGLNIYIHEDAYTLLDEIRNDHDADWRLIENKKATITVAFEDGIYLVAIYSFP